MRRFWDWQSDISYSLTLQDKPIIINKMRHFYSIFNLSLILNFLLCIIFYMVRLSIVMDHLHLMIPHDDAYFHFFHIVALLFLLS